MQPIQIPTRLGEPMHILFWPADEIVPMIAGLVIGIVIEQALICFLIGMFVAKLYGRFRDNHPDGYLRHMFFHWGFGFTKCPSMINPFIKRLIP